eukprot:scaffold2700_cov18-Tisochrysis_lutea.AAC.1
MASMCLKTLWCMEQQRHAARAVLASNVSSHYVIVVASAHCNFLDIAAACAHAAHNTHTSRCDCLVYCPYCVSSYGWQRMLTSLCAHA